MAFNKILPVIGNKLLTEIKAEDGHKLINSLQDHGHNSKGTNKIFLLFKQILKEAEKDGIIFKNPLTHVAPLKEVQRSPTYWSLNDINKFLRTIRVHHCYELYVTALNTGLRRGELCGLKWDKVHFDKSLIEVSRMRTRDGLTETTKSKVFRFVPMNETVKAILLELHKRRSNVFLFLNTKNEPISVHHCYRDFKKLQADAQIEKTIRFHDLRHTFASQFMMHGGNLYDLQKILGHSDSKMTQIYAHLSPEHLSKTTDIISFGGYTTDKDTVSSKKLTAI
jgi:site-specific recombinase XerD